jgi:hypothetical protein
MEGDANRPPSPAEWSPTQMLQLVRNRPPVQLPTGSTIAPEFASANELACELVLDVKDALKVDVILLKKTESGLPKT